MKDCPEKVAFEKWLGASEKLKTEIKETMSSRDNSSFKAPEEGENNAQCIWGITNRKGHSGWNGVRKG